MTDIIWMLFYVAVFYFMMRFGCGAHTGHRGHGGHRSNRERDPHEGPGNAAHT